MLRHQLRVLRRHIDRRDLAEDDRTLLGEIATPLPRPGPALLACHAGHAPSLASVPCGSALDQPQRPPTVDLPNPPPARLMPDDDVSWSLIVDDQARWIFE